MKLYPARQCCGADVTMVTTVRSEWRGNPKVLRYAKKVFHARGSERFWHWSDVEVVSPTTKSATMGTVHHSDNPRLTS